MSSVQLKDPILTGFFCNYLLVFTGILAPPKSGETQGEPQGWPQCVFNCSGVGYFAMAPASGSAKHREPGGEHGQYAKKTPCGTQWFSFGSFGEELD